MTESSLCPVWVDPLGYEPARDGPPYLPQGRYSGPSRLVFAGQGADYEGMFKQQATDYGIPAGNLAALLAVLRAEADIALTHHWQASGPQAYADHLMFERIYKALLEAIDSVAERAVGLGDLLMVQPVLQDHHRSAWLKSIYGSVGVLPAVPLAALSLNAAYMGKLGVNLALYGLKEAEALTGGVEDLLQGIESSHEEFEYLLSQRTERRHVMTRTSPRQVLARYFEAMEFDTPEALKKYMHDHPDADPHNHSVKKHEDKKDSEKADSESKKHPEHDHTEHTKKLDDEIGSALKKLTAQNTYKYQEMAKFIESTKALRSPARKKLLTSILGPPGALKDVLSKVDSTLDSADNLSMDAQRIIHNLERLTHNGLASKGAWEFRQKTYEEAAPLVRKFLDARWGVEEGKEHDADMVRHGIEYISKWYHRGIVKRREKMEYLKLNNGLMDADEDEVKAFKKRKPKTGVKLNDAQLMAKFLKEAKPETRERMKTMSVADFKAMMAAIKDEE